MSNIPEHLLPVTALLSNGERDQARKNESASVLRLVVKNFNYNPEII